MLTSWAHLKAFQVGVESDSFINIGRNVEVFWVRIEISIDKMRKTCTL
jgi:hypothetical protein